MTSDPNFSSPLSVVYVDAKPFVRSGNWLLFVLFVELDVGPGVELYLVSDVDPGVADGVVTGVAPVANPDVWSGIGVNVWLDAGVGSTVSGLCAPS